MKETGQIKPGVESRDERDADNTSCNIDEQTEGKRRVVVEAALTAGAKNHLFSWDASVQMLQCSPQGCPLRK